MLNILTKKICPLTALALVALLAGCSGDVNKVADPTIKIGGTGVANAFDDAVKAAFEGDLAYVTQCVESDAAYTQVADGQGRTLLHYAAEGGHADIVKYLLEHNAIASAQDNDGYTPMDTASQGAGTPEILTLIREAAARQTGQQ